MKIGDRYYLDFHSLFDKYSTSKENNTFVKLHYGRLRYTTDKPDDECSCYYDLFSNGACEIACDGESAIVEAIDTENNCITMIIPDKECVFKLGFEEFNECCIKLN